MPTFQFQGRNMEGKAISGKRLALSANNLSEQLIKEGIVPININLEQENLSVVDKIKSSFLTKSALIQELTMFSRQMHVLAKTGVPITDAIRELAQSSHNQQFAYALHGIVERLEAGMDLAGAMQQYESIFTPLMISIIRVGQDSGRLDEAFLNINEYLELEGGAIKKLSASLRYPTFVLIAIVAAIVLMNIFVLPTFAKIFAQANIELPKVTLFLLAMSRFFTHYWYILLISIVAIVIAIHLALKQQRYRLIWDGFKFKIPVLGHILRRIVLLRFAQTFAVTLHSEIPIDDGLKLSAKALGNAYASEEVMKVREKIQHGNSFVQAAKTSDLFTPLELQMLAVSDKTGELQSILEQLVIFYQREVNYDIKRITDLVEPLLIIMLAGMIAVLAFAVYLPIWNMVKVVH